MSDLLLMKFVCSDRGQHPPRHVGTVQWLGRGLFAPNDGPPEHYRFCCRTCRRDVQIRAEKLRALEHADVWRVDISHLPF